MPRKLGGAKESSRFGCAECGADLCKRPHNGMRWPCRRCQFVDNGKIVVRSWVTAANCSPEGLRELDCPVCNSILTIYGFLWRGGQLPPALFQRYPAAWRLAYYAVYECPERAVSYVEHELRRPSIARAVEIARRWNEQAKAEEEAWHGVR